MTLTLHEHPFASYCWKPLIALYERDVPFARVQVDADRGPLAQLWPTASIPVLVDDAAGVTLGESSVIVEYLDRFGAAAPLMPAQPDAALPARLWDRVIDGDVATPMQKIVADSLRAPDRRDPQGVQDAHAQLARICEVIDERLRATDWLGGESFTLADCAAAPALFYTRVVSRWDERRLADLTRYYTALVARPAVARVIDEARPFRALFPLPWPEDIH